jgi:hypothetical protein
MVNHSSPLGYGRRYPTYLNRLHMPSPEKILMAIVGTLLAGAIALLMSSVAFENATMRTIGLYLFGGAVFFAFLPLVLLLVMLPFERFVKQNPKDE